jgi:copper chaperone CopZ
VTETIRFPIRGMTCAGCVNRITRQLRKVPGVESASVDLRGETATVRRAAALTPDTALAAAVAAAGYEADVGSAELVQPSATRPFLARLLRR